MMAASLTSAEKNLRVGLTLAFTAAFLFSTRSLVSAHIALLIQRQPRSPRSEARFRKRIPVIRSAPVSCREENDR